MNSTAELQNLDNDKTSHREGKVARTIEKQTAKLPSDLFLWSALGAIGVAATLEMSGRKQGALFVGQWVAPFLLLGIYNKIVKVAGSDQMDQQSTSEDRFATNPGMEASAAL